MRDKFPERPARLRCTRVTSRMKFLTYGKVYEVTFPGSQGWRVSLIDDRGQKSSWAVTWFSREDEPWAGT